MFGNKTILFLMSVLVVILITVSACSPSSPPKTTPQTAPSPQTPVTTPATIPTTPASQPATVPAAVEKPTSFESARYTNDTYGFSIRYPKTWTSEKVSLPTAVFYGKGGDDLVYVDIRPATNFTDASVALLGDLIAAKGLIVAPNVEVSKTTTLADGKTPGYEVLLSASVLFQTKNAYCFGILKDGKAIIVMAGIDPKNLALFKEICQTLAFK